MGLLRRKVPPHLIPIHPDNAAKKDWVILLEAGTIRASGTSEEMMKTDTIKQAYLGV